MATAVANSSGFKIEVTDRGLARNLPQRLGRALWLPMLLMGVMAFPIGVILGAIRADEIATGGSPSTIAALAHAIPAVNFIGFAAVFAAITFAIARILGELRVGGGQVQEATHGKVKTLKMPATAKVMIGGMMMAMMAIVASVVLHFVAASALADGSTYALNHSEEWSFWLEGVRRTGVGLYLLSITLGLASIVEVVRFQAIRIHELPGEAGSVRAA
jgi:hypothetical protein